LSSCWTLNTNQSINQSSHLPFVPTHTWSNSNLKVRRTFPPDLLHIPAMGAGGKGSFTFLSPGITSSGLPYLSNTFLCSWKNHDFQHYKI